MPRLLSNSSRNAVDESRKPSSKAIKSKKSTSTSSRKFNLNAKDQDRLIGGADVPEAEEPTTPTQETQEEITVSASVVDTTSEPENGKSLPVPSAGPCCFCVSQVPGSTGETIAVCKREVTVKGCVTHRSGGGRNYSREQGSSVVKRPCGSPCCSAGKSRKSASSNSMLFLLHQGDAGNVCGSNNTPPPKVCGSPMMKKIEIPPCPRFR